jgi:hypothetical protein
MSLLLAYHDTKRAVVCCDDLAVSFNSTGQPERIPARVPKFILVGACLFCLVGRSDVCDVLRAGTRRMLAAHPDLNIDQTSGIIGDAAKSAWAKRIAQPKDAPLNCDALELALIGYDREQRRVRAFGLCSYSNFGPFETSEDSNPRTFALGNYGPDELPLLHRLTDRMRQAAGRGLPWIAVQLRDALADMHAKCPTRIGEPSFYAALGRTGFVDLPSEFPMPSSNEVALADAHRVTTVKEEAINAAGRFFVGSIVTPGQGKIDSNGNNDGGSGAQSGMTNSYYLASFGSFDTIAPGGNGSKTGEANMVDGNFNDFAAWTVTGNGSAANSAASSFNFGQLSMIRRQGPMVVKILYSVPTNGLNGGGLQALAIVGVAYTDANGNVQQAFPVQVPAGTVVAQTLATVSIPPGASNFVINASVQTRAVDTAGTLILHVIEAWAEIAE